MFVMLFLLLRKSLFVAVEWFLVVEVFFFCRGRRG